MVERILKMPKNLENIVSITITILVVFNQNSILNDLFPNSNNSWKHFG